MGNYPKFLKKGINNSPKNLALPWCGYTMWMFQHFCVTQILHFTINFGEYKSAKTTVFAILEALNFVFLTDFSLQKVQKSIQIKIQRL